MLVKWQEQGETLVEVVASMLLLSLVLATVYAVSTSTALAVKREQYTEHAFQLAKDLVSEIRLGALMPTKYPMPAEQTLLGGSAGDATQYRETWLALGTPSYITTSNSGITEYSVTVTWTNARMQQAVNLQFTVDQLAATSHR